MHILLYDNFLWTVRFITLLIFKCKVSQVKFLLESFRLIEDFLQHFFHTTDSGLRSTLLRCALFEGVPELCCQTRFIMIEC